MSKYELFTAHHAEAHFDINTPTKDLIKKIDKGYFLKVGVIVPKTGHAERFWVIVEDRKGHRFRVRVNNDLVYRMEHGLDEGTEMEIEDIHVLGLLPPPRVH